jgi:hypothetical protein
VSPDEAVVVAAIAAALSAITALVSVVALVLSVWLQWRAGQPHVDVEGVITRLISASFVGQPRFGIEVRNVGTLAIVVTSVGVTFRDREMGALPTVTTFTAESLPKPLAPGEAVSLSNALEPVVRADRERSIRGVWARTAAGGLYRGKNRAKLGAITLPDAELPDPLVNPDS